MLQVLVQGWARALGLDNEAEERCVRCSMLKDNNGCEHRLQTTTCRFFALHIYQSVRLRTASSEIPQGGPYL